MKKILTLLLLCTGIAYGQITISGNVTLTGTISTTVEAGWSYSSSVFDGSADWLSRGANLTGIADSKTGLVSFWIKSSGSGVRYDVICDNAIAKFRLRLGSDNKIEMNTTDNGGATALRLNSNTTTITADGNWHHVLLSWDLAHAAYGYCYIDGMDASARSVFVNTNVNYTAVTDWGIGAYPGTGLDKLNGLVSEMWFNTEFLDITVQGNREKFRTAGGKPVNLGANGSTPTGNQPLIYLRNPYNSFQTNLGSGGNFTVHGALADGGADIP